MRRHGLVPAARGPPRVRRQGICTRLSLSPWRGSPWARSQRTRCARSPCTTAAGSSSVQPPKGAGGPFSCLPEYP